MKDENGIIWTPTGLIRWPALFTPTLPKGADPSKTPQFQATCILAGNEPTYEAFRQEIMEELDRASISKFGTSVAEMRQRGRFKVAVKSNSDPETGKASKPGFKERPNGIHFSATTNFKPSVLDRERVPMSKDREDEIYDGIFGVIGITAWGWDHPTGGKGLSLNLHGVWKKFEGERLGGGQVDMSNVPDDGYVPEGADVAPRHDEPDPNRAQQNGGGGGGGNAGGGGNFGF